MGKASTLAGVWTGSKSCGTDPVGTYPRLSGWEPMATLSVEVNS